jgi:hypothetical protein
MIDTQYNMPVGVLDFHLASFRPHPTSTFTVGSGQPLECFRLDPMAAPTEKKQVLEEVEMDDDLARTKTLHGDHSSDSDAPPLQRTQTTMNKEKWLACIALCLAYTTAFQQNSCTGAILKQIDEALGMTIVK